MTSPPLEPPVPAVPQAHPHTHRHLLSEQGVLLAAIGGQSAFNFLYHSLMARRLGPTGYANLSALNGVFYLLNVCSLVLLTVVMGEVAGARAEGQPGATSALVGRLARPLALAALAGVLVMAGLSPFLQDFLHLPSLWPGLALALTVPLLATVAVVRGSLQGERRFIAAAMSYLSDGSAKVVVAVGLVGLGMGVVGAVGALAAGLLLGSLAGGWALARHWRTHSGPVHFPAIGANTARVALGLLGVTLLQAVDVILARHYLPGGEAGRYAGLAIVAKIALFAGASFPQALFPAVASASGPGGRHLRHRALLVALAGWGAVTLCFLLTLWFGSHIWFRLFFGAGAAFYEPANHLLGVLGLGMAALSAVNLLVNYLLARGDRKFLYPLFGGAILMVVLLKLSHTTAGDVVAGVDIACAVTLAAMLVRLMWVERIPSS